MCAISTSFSPAAARSRPLSVKSIVLTFVEIAIECGAKSEMPTNYIYKIAFREAKIHSPVSALTARRAHIKTFIPKCRPGAPNELFRCDSFRSAFSFVSADNVSVGRWDAKSIRLHTIWSEDARWGIATYVVSFCLATLGSSVCVRKRFRIGNS